MPASSRAQKAFMGAELGRAEAGEETETGMSTEQLKDFTRGSAKGLPRRAKKRHGKRRGRRK